MPSSLSAWPTLKGLDKFGRFSAIFTREREVEFSLPLIEEGHFSVSGDRMCTVLVNRLEDKACPVKVWLGKLTALT